MHLFSSTDLHRNSGCFRKPLQDSSNLQSRSYRKVPRGKSLRAPTSRVSYLQGSFMSFTPYYTEIRLSFMTSILA